MTLAELEREMRECRIVAVNIHAAGDGFRVHVRHSLDQGFDCAQRQHTTISAALEEHFPTNGDLSGLLI